MRKVRAITLFTFTPMSAAVRLSWAEARIARPMRVRPTYRFSANMTTIVTTTTKTCR